MTPSLTPRQMQVAELLAAGHSRKQVAATLGVSVNTVRAHIAAIAWRLPGDGNLRVRVVRWALQRQESLAKPPPHLLSD